MLKSFIDKTDLAVRQKRIVLNLYICIYEIKNHSISCSLTMMVASIIAKSFLISKDFLKFLDVWTRPSSHFQDFKESMEAHVCKLRWFVLRYTECGHPEHPREVGMHSDPADSC